jgi:hypothetical protein
VGNSATKTVQAVDLVLLLLLLLLMIAISVLLFSRDNQCRQAGVCVECQSLLCLILVVVVSFQFDQSICSVADLDGCEAHSTMEAVFPLLAWLACEVKRLLALSPW